MNNLYNRKILKAKRKIKGASGTNININKNAEYVKPEYSEIKQNCEPSRLEENSLNRNKREYNKTSFGNISTSPTFSANDRLKKYRTSLNSRKNEIVKVHQVLNAPSTNLEEYDSNTSLNNSSNSKPNEISGKGSLYKKSKNELMDDEISFKKSKIQEKCENVKTYFSNSYTEPCTSVDNSEMDWSPVDQDEVVSNIQKFRDNCKENPCLIPDPIPFTTGTNVTTYTDSNSKEKVLYIVVDTNIFISHLNIIKNLLSEEYKGQHFIIYVPWMVIQELDYFKDGRSNSSAIFKAAKTAVKFLNQNLIDKHPRLQGQTILDALNQKESTSIADDNILLCCIKLTQTSKTVILLSNDVNLRNKAMINNITSYSPTEITVKIKELHDYDVNNQKVEEINELCANMCTNIIVSEMEEAYGSELYKLITKPPWDFKQCLVYIKRFWQPVFSLVISQKQCLKVVDDLLESIQTCKDLSTEENKEEFIKLCFSLCIYFKNCLRKYQRSVMCCINDMQKVVN